MAEKETATEDYLLEEYKSYDERVGRLDGLIGNTGKHMWLHNRLVPPGFP